MYNRICIDSGDKVVKSPQGTYVFNKPIVLFYLTMKLTAILILVFSFQVSAYTYAQRITLRVTNAPLENVLKQIQQQSGYNFMFNNQYLKTANPVTLDISDVGVSSALLLVFENQPYDYRIEGEIVTLIPKKKDESASVIRHEAAQQSIRGRVVDSLGTPLTGVSVFVKGTSRGTSTDSEGRYEIQANSNEILVFRYVGYISQEAVLGTQTSLDIVLEVEESDLDEVVVVGYGTQKKETITGAISSIQTKEIKQSPASNLAVSLAGKLPGLTVIQSAGEPGREGVNLYLRGVRTLNGQSPLILVDGVPRELTYIDPNEVESVTILKDASSTAVFGVKGANGVILVTTKRGESDKPQIALSFENAYQQFNRIPQPVGALDYVTLTNQARANDDRAELYSDEVIEHFRLQDRPDIYPDNDWMDMMVKDNTRQTRANLNVSGKTRSTAYFVNVGALHQDGLWKVSQDEYDASSSLKRYNFRSNIDINLNRNLTAFLNIGGYLEVLNKPNPNADNLMLLYSTYTYPSIMPGPLTPDGEVIGHVGSDSNPPWGIINKSGYSQEKRTNVTASYGMKQDLSSFITEGLSAQAMASFDTRTIYHLNASQTFQQWLMEVGQDEAGNEIPVYSRRDQTENTPLALSSSSNFLSYLNIQGSLNYERDFDNHALTALLLYQQEEQLLQGQRLPFRVIGAVSRLTYGYSNKYFAEFNAGYNGSEQFSRKNRFGFFPSVSASWIISRENFLQNNPVLSFLKFRGSYGVVGNDRLGGSRFLYLDDVKLTGGGIIPGLYGGQLIEETAIGNPDLRWEVSRKGNLGIEVGLFNQVDLVADFYREKTENMLINRQQFTQILGLSGLPPLNIGIVENQGFEVELRHRKAFSQHFSILSKVNLNYAKNKLIFNDEPLRPETYAYRYQQQGFPIGQQFGYLTNGFWGSQEEIDNSGLVYQVGAGQPRVGDLKYVDLNGDGTINEEDISPILHSSIPEFTFGGALSVNYRSFDVSFLLQGVSRVSRPYTGNGIYEVGQGNSVFFDIHKNAWTPERAANGDKITWPALGSSINANHIQNAFFIWDASYLRLKSFEVGYTIPNNLISRMRMQSMRVYATALNPLTWDKFPTKEYDPELSWVLAYPIQRMFNFGVNVVF
ncbi:MAG TPA: TonB-dependent receptor [Parapedobacter sp.]|uniref:SusC/RagA family TonB-linked outer membrane protein n=1 Tax=Parapedobacter sp. TaxID=1958893 RepID=UPI002B8D564F|nr:TonB-dependent receptor [Parapedobacter sp.]HWK57792.1 TonB-dependent receptor [Parapedobacter sp.]